MLVVFWASMSKEREMRIARALGEAVEASGHTFELRSTTDFKYPRGDLGCIFGVKRPARRFIDEHKRVGANFLFFDKPHFRQKLEGEVMYRASLNSYMPGELTRYDDGERFRRLRRPVCNWMKGEAIVIAGGSQKHADFNGLGNATEWAEDVVRQVREQEPQRPIVYRPKPSWHDAVPIADTRFSGRAETIQQVLDGAWCLITHSSNAVVDAIVAGVPTFVLGEHPARKLSSTKLDDYGWLGMEAHSRQAREDFLADLMWCNFTVEEIRSGWPWANICRQLGWCHVPV